MTPCNNHRCGMQPPSRRTVVGMLAAIGAGTALGLRRSAAQTTASSEDWIVSFAAGGPNDIVARIVGQYLSDLVSLPV